MSVIQKGSPIVFSLGDGPAKYLKIGSSSEVKVYLQNVRLSKGADSQVIPDGNGEEVGVVYFNQKKNLSLSLFISGSSVSNAETAFQTSIEIGDELILSYDDWPEIDSDASSGMTGDTTNGSGQFIIDSAEKVRATGQIAEWSIVAIQRTNDLT